jgi:hypothetical protein
VYYLAYIWFQYSKTNGAKDGQCFKVMVEFPEIWFVKKGLQDGEWEHYSTSCVFGVEEVYLKGSTADIMLLFSWSSLKFSKFIDSNTSPQCLILLFDKSNTRTPKQAKWLNKNSACLILHHG